MIVGSKEIGAVLEEKEKDETKTLTADRFIWKEIFPQHSFIAFFDRDSPPISLGTVDALKLKGITSSILLSPLLLPEESGDESRVLYRTLMDMGFFSKEEVDRNPALLTDISPDRLKMARQELLVDSVLLDSTFLTERLIRDGANVNVPSTVSWMYPINYAKSSDKEEHRRLLISSGADINQKPEPMPFED